MILIVHQTSLPAVPVAGCHILLRSAARVSRVFAALSYEIIWYRLLAFCSGDTAGAFASLLGAYLFGLALGSRHVERYSQSLHRENAVRTLSALH
jgi:predicted membrane-bound spermidine synthase